MAYAEVNGLSLYYEDLGEAEPLGHQPPLILLHGGLGGGDMFAPILPALGERRRVIVVDLQAHAHTADVDRPLRFETCADDVAALIRHLGMDRADVMGYSFGGSVALRIAIQHPHVVRKLVVVSTPFRRDGFFEDVLRQQGQMSPEAAWEGTPMWETYRRSAPRPEDFPRLIAKVRELLATDYDYSQEIRELTAPTLLVYADADTYPMTHVTEFWALLGGGLRDAGWAGEGRPGAHRLAVLPGTTHYNVFVSSGLVAAVDDFLEGPPPSAAS